MKLPSGPLCGVLFLAVYAWPLCVAKADPAADHKIVPGERVGFLTQRTTEEQLRRRLAPNQMKRVLQDEGGELRCGTEIFPNSDKAVVLIWKDAVQEGADEKRCENAPPFRRIESVLIERPDSYWRTREGVGVGTNLEQLERANGAPVTFATGAFCGSGYVTSWNNGRLDGSRYKDLHNGSGPLLEVYLEDLPELEAYATLGEAVSTRIASEMKREVSIIKIVISLEKGVKWEAEQ